MEYRDYYQALGVPRTASQAEIRKAFRRLARQHHPDVNKGNADAERRFKEINEAHAVLGDAEKRRAYDTLGADWAAYQHAGGGRGAGAADNPFADFVRRSHAGGPGAPGGVRFEYRGSAEDLSGFSEFFRTFFGGGKPGSGAARASTTGAGIDYDDLLGGFGFEPAEETARARRGAGGGPRRSGQGPAMARREDVEAVTEVTLEEVFGGTSRLLQVGDRRYEVKIPAGVAEGQRIRLSGKAGTGPAAGDVYVKVRVLAHPVFERNGDDLTRELAVSLRDALLGGEVTVETLSGARLLLRIPRETQNGRMFRLAGQGLPRFHGDGRGELYVRVRVVLPTGLDERARELASRFLDAVDRPGSAAPTSATA